MEENYYFSEIAFDGSSSVKFDNLNIIIDDLKLTTNDTSLFVENEKYIVDLALAPLSNPEKNLIHLEKEGLNHTTYKLEKSFTVTQDGTFKIPYVNIGDYVLVSYIATEDGIRVIKPKKINLDNFIESSYDSQNMQLTLTNIDGKQVFKYGNINEIYLAK